MSRTSNKPSAIKSPSQGGKEFLPMDVLRVSSLEQLKTISDPLRVEILETVAGKALTVKQVADLLKKPPTKLYYHMSALENAGFVVVVETRIKSGILEKYYRAAAESIDVDRGLLNTQPGGEEETFKILQSSILASTIEDLNKSQKAGLLSKTRGESKGDAMVFSKSVISISEEDAKQFVNKFKALVKEYDKPQKAAKLNYVCTVAFFPKAQKRAGKTARQGQ